MNMAKLCNDRETFVQLPESVPIRFNYASVKWADSEEREKTVQLVFLLLVRGHND